MPDQLTEQEQLFGIREDDFGTLEAANERLYPFLRTVRSLVDEAKMDPTDDGLHICAVDSGNVSMVDATVGLDGTVPDNTIGVNVKSLAGKLQNKPRSTTTHIECAIPYGVLRIDEEFANGRVWDLRERVGFLDPDSIRGRPDIPELDYSVTAEFSIDELATIINRCPRGHPIELSVGDGKLSIGATADSKEENEGEYRTLATTDFDGDAEVSALYSSGYLGDILTGIRATGADSVTASWDDEFPIKIDANGEHISTEWFIAPRIPKD